MQQLAHDLPRLWQSATTTAKDQKRILRLLLKDITLEKRPETHQAILHLRWQGGATEDLTVELPLKVADRWRYPETLVNKVRQLAQQQTDQQIAQALNQEGLQSLSLGLLHSFQVFNRRGFFNARAYRRRPR